jgi:hypothetical protein
MILGGASPRSVAPGPACALVLALLAAGVPSAQDVGVPSARLVSAPRLALPGEVDSSNPLVWDLVDGAPRLFALSSWGGVPKLASGPDVTRLQVVGPASFTVHPGHGVWFESILADDGGVWYGFYHHERAADECGRRERQLPRIGAARSVDRGLTWDDLGIVLDAPPASDACDSSNRFVLGGVGDVSAMLEPGGQDVYLYFSQYSRDPEVQGVAVARLAWADRDAPGGKVSVWNDGAWLPAAPIRAEDESAVGWAYPAGTPLVRATRPFHDGNASADVFWGPAIHWNTYLERYVMLINRARDDQFNQDGIYVSYSPTLADPSAWSAPQKIMTGGGWYPQAVGLESAGTDRLAGRRARFFITGNSDQFIEFER